MTVNLSDITLTPIFDSVYREKLSDVEYFSDKYSNYISNSRLKLINPDQDGCPSKYKKGFIGETGPSLSKGDATHKLFLQPESFSLGPDLGKPAAKLGLVIDIIRELRTVGYTINDSIIKACQRVHYYENSITSSKIKTIIKLGFKYYWYSKTISDDSLVLLSSKDRRTVQNCIKNLNANSQITKLINPIDSFGDPVLSYNEDAFFIDINAVYNNQHCVIKLKMKADNWTVNTFDKIITLNDLKTSSSMLNKFMSPDGSFEHFHYSRQFAMYSWILLKYCEKKYNFNQEEWTFRCNVIVVETTSDNRAGVFSINNNFLNQGRKEFCKLLKMVAYCEMNDYLDDIIFI